MPSVITTVDSLVQGVAGPSALSADGSRLSLRMGKTGEAIVGQAHARYYEAVLRGRVYSAAMQAGGSMGTALTATAVTLTLYNPVGSGVNLVLLSASVAMTTVPSGAGTSNYALAGNVNTLAAVPATNTAATVRNNLLGGVAGVGIAYTATTLPAVPVILRVIPGGIYWATAAAAAAPMAMRDEVDGALILVPNTAVTIQGIGAASSGIAGMTWEEVPTA